MVNGEGEEGGEDGLSALQHMRQIQEASPWRIMRIVRLLDGCVREDIDGWARGTYTTLDVRVPRLPMKERIVMVRSVELGLFL